jgi:hypothetical protein
MFIDDMPPTNVLGRGPRRGCDKWPVILVGEPMNILGPGGDLRLKHDLNRRIYGFYFLPLPILTASPDGEPLKQIEYT